MSDLREDFKVLNDHRKDQHQQWFKINCRTIEKSGLSFTWSSPDHTCMLFRNPRGPQADFYPHTGRWKYHQRFLRGGGQAFVKWYQRKSTEEYYGG